MTRTGKDFGKGIFSGIVQTINFLTENSKYTSMDDLIWRSGFGIMNLLEVEQVNQDKWNEYIARNTECKTWHEFGKLAMIDWMKHKLEEAKQAKN